MIHRFNIYCVTNKVNGKRYVGQTVGAPAVRWKEHVSAAKRNAGSRLLAAAIRKYGADAFAVDLIDPVTTQRGADIAETRWIEQRRTRAPGGYNLAVGGGGPGYHHEESKRRIGEASSARLQAMTPEERSAHVKKSWSPERKKSASERKRGRPLSSEAKEKLRAAWASLTPEERSERVRHQLAGMTTEQLGARIRKAWANASPEARAERTRKIAERGREVGHLRSEKMSDWQTARQRTLTPEQRSANTRKGWETRRRNKP